MRTSKKALGLMRKSITARASHRPIDLCHAAAILSQEIKKSFVFARPPRSHCEANRAKTKLF